MLKIRKIQTVNSRTIHSIKRVIIKNINLMKNYLLGIITTIAIYAIFGFIIETNELEAHKKE